MPAFGDVSKSGECVIRGIIRQLSPGKSTILKLKPNICTSILRLCVAFKNVFYLIVISLEANNVRKKKDWKTINIIISKKRFITWQKRPTRVYYYLWESTTFSGNKSSYNSVILFARAVSQWIINCF